MIRTHAPAKVNLTLEVLGRRADGYHEIRALTTFASFGDRLEISAAEGVHLTLDGPFAADAGAGEGNLVLKAARLLQQVCGTARGARIHLTKEIPVGAGLGGGSADAASVLRALNELWGCGLAPDALAALAPQLGADVAMCLHARPLIAEGIGERITLLPEGMPTLAAVLVHPRVPLLTADVYRALAMAPPRAASTTALARDPLPATAAEFIGLLAESRNDLQEAACRVSPQVGHLLAALGALQPAPPLVRMTGSGACCYALFETAEQADRAAATLAAQHPEWWVRATVLGAS